MEDRLDDLRILCEWASALPGVDYTNLTGSVVIPSNAVLATITVTPIEDTEPELSETVVATLADGIGYTVGTSNTATVVIADPGMNPWAVNSAALIRIWCLVPP